MKIRKQNRLMNRCIKSTKSGWTHLLILICFFFFILFSSHLSTVWGNNKLQSFNQSHQSWVNFIGSLCENKCWNLHHTPTASLSRVLLIRLEILCFSLGLDPISFFLVCTIFSSFKHTYISSHPNEQLNCVMKTMHTASQTLTSQTRES